MRAIDVRHKGQEKVICCWEVDGVLIDPGPGVTEETLLAALDGERPRALLLTHIHFDHAGVSGALVQTPSGLHICWVFGFRSEPSRQSSIGSMLPPDCL